MRLHKYRIHGYNRRLSKAVKHWTVHTIRESDTLYHIAEEYQTGVIDILRYNQQTDPRQLLVGDRLLIPPGRTKI